MRTSFGGRRVSIAPVGMGTVRKKTASSALGEGMSSIQRVSWAWAARAAARNSVVRRRKRLRHVGLGGNFNLHLPATDVVGEVFRGYGQDIFSRRDVGWDQHLARVR